MRVDRLIKRLKRDIGIYGIALPIDNLDTFITDILEDTTVPVFSLYVPRYEILACDAREFTRATNDRAEVCDLYILPERLFQGREVLYVRKVEYISQLGDYSTRYPSIIHNGYGGFPVNSMESIMMANAQKPITDNLVNPVTFHYEYPRKLYIYDDLVSTSLRITLACEHDTSMQSITPTSAESFYKLAILDVEAALYNQIKPYLEQGGAYDKIELKVDDWAEASKNRTDLLDRWDELYGLDYAGFEYG
jgi:hypothetical protein